ncbi:hypothetical protein LY76DRAFT_185055 [Colletotrichum caudatum]|nr:hypothetical protein LY76DRAFT_185055 [Colletotrichum caudatum]
MDSKGGLFDCPGESGQRLPDAFRGAARDWNGIDWTGLDEVRVSRGPERGAGYPFPSDKAPTGRKGFALLCAVHDSTSKGVRLGLFVISLAVYLPVSGLVYSFLTAFPPPPPSRTSSRTKAYARHERKVPSVFPLGAHTTLFAAGPYLLSHKSRAAHIICRASRSRWHTGWEDWLGGSPSRGIVEAERGFLVPGFRAMTAEGTSFSIWETWGEVFCISGGMLHRYIRLGLSLSIPRRRSHWHRMPVTGSAHVVIPVASPE